MVEKWVSIEYDPRYEVSNFGRFRKKLKTKYRYLLPFKKRRLFVVKINNKTYIASRLVAHYFIKPLSKGDRVYHKNKIPSDNFYKNLKVLSISECSKRTGHLSNSRAVIKLEKGEIVGRWRSARQAAKDLYISRQTVCDYCNKKTRKPLMELMWEDNYEYNV